MASKTANANLVEKFEYKGYTCLIIRNANLLDVYCNGYIKVADSKEEVEQKIKEEEPMKGADITYERFLKDIDAEELTYSGTLSTIEDAPEGYYLGFDSAHLWNEESPNSKTPEAVKKRLKRTLEDFIVHNVFERIKLKEEQEVL